ncbi:hydroxymyristoyl-ACP dehydratase [Zunongwangia sp. F363]|uniref:Hydroxymyristoyl-ACP dehydratase n=1 Tax=Autumnicola tepida TaxID=3075595 RepID=A0ABU3C692_9FLAO|nr:hotdog domain-containing protein [Zunongwangia sp. F363]MDT0641834.1 hydroxymyristoyl-ACP dehydratase [Zunongwangia sp. F363]
MDQKTILSRLPYSQPFLFIDKIIAIDENAVSGTYTFPPDSFFYKGHFKDNPVTPGVILTECMAQIGLVCLGIFLLNKEKPAEAKTGVAMTSSEMDFFKPVFPGERVKVKSEKIYFRFNKLKCKVEMYDAEDNLVCKGILAGMMRK